MPSLLFLRSLKKGITCPPITLLMPFWCVSSAQLLMCCATSRVLRVPGLTFCSRLLPPACLGMDRCLTSHPMLLVCPHVAPFPIKPGWPGLAWRLAEVERACGPLAPVRYPPRRPLAAAAPRNPRGLLPEHHQGPEGPPDRTLPREVRAYGVNYAAKVLVQMHGSVHERVRERTNAHCLGGVDLSDVGFNAQPV